MYKRKDHLKIVHCPTTVGGNPQGLSRAERRLGIDSCSITFLNNFFNYDADRVIFEDNDGVFKRELKRWCLIWHILKTYDVIHYNFGMTLSPSIYISPNRKKHSYFKVWVYNNLYARWFEMLDLKLAKLMGKIILVTYQGDDARQGDYCLDNYPIHFCRDVGKTYYTAESDAYKRKCIALFNKYANLIYAVNPDLLNVLPARAKFIPYASVNPRDWVPINNDLKELDIPHIVHAPSHRDVKGTKYIVAAFERLKAENIKFRYTLVEGVSNSAARKIYETADILVDQLLAGYYGGLAVELMALGKPVICYMRDSDLHYMPQEMRQEIPIINANPENIYDVLKAYLTVHKDDLASIGKRSRDYVEKWHDPEKIARQIYEDISSCIKEEHH